MLEKNPKKNKVFMEKYYAGLEEELYDSNTESSLKILDIYRIIRSGNRRLQIDPEDIKEVLDFLASPLIQGVECVNQDEYCAIRTVEDIKKTMQFYSN